MINPQALDKIKQYVIARVEHSVLTTDDAWQHEVSGLLPLYLQLLILDRLESIDDTLILIMQQGQPSLALRKMAEKALQEMAAGETEEGGFAIEEKEQ
jgi:hypothetical protein